MRLTLEDVAPIHHGETTISGTSTEQGLSTIITIVTIIGTLKGRLVYEHRICI